MTVVKTQSTQKVSAYLKGDTGESAYAYAVRVNGYVGTEVEYYNQMRRVWEQPDEPTGAVEGDIWIQTT